jgi:hypothetical protein
LRVWGLMEHNAIVATPLVLVFVLGAAVGALLNSMYRAAMIAKIKAEFQRQLDEVAGGDGRSSGEFKDEEKDSGARMAG